MAEIRKKPTVWARVNVPADKLWARRLSARSNISALARI